MEKEIWKKIPGFKDFYEVSNFGNLRSFSDKQNGKMMTPSREYRGELPLYLKTVLRTIDNKNRTRPIHNLVMLAFCGPTPKGMVINHIDGNKLNNRLDNLEFITQGQNIQHAYDHGLREKKFFGISYNSKEWKEYIKNGRKKANSTENTKID